MSSKLASAAELSPVAPASPNIRSCARCLYDETIPAIAFDGEGVCNYCRTYERMLAEYPGGAAGEAKLQEMVAEIKEAGRGKKYDCIVGVSGGCDSSYLVYRMVQYGLRPLAVHFDNTFNSPIATQNIHKVLGKLGVDLYTHVWSNKEADDLFRAFMLAGVKELETPTDIGFIATLYRAAVQHRVKYILEGHSYRTEGFTPPGWMYIDGKYIESVHARFGTMPLKTFPNLTLARFLAYTGIYGIKRLQPIFYMDYDKEEVKKLLSEKFGWQWYGGHHLENRMTIFFHTYYIPKRFREIDYRLVSNSALVRSGQITREEGLQLIREEVKYDPELVDMIKKRLGFSDAEFASVMAAPVKSYLDYETYRETFYKLRPLFWFLYKRNLVVESFYKKFCERKPI